MHAALLLGLLASSPTTELQSVSDLTTLQIALERSQALAEQLLTVLPDNVKDSPRPRIQAMLADVRRDQARLAREGKSPLFEAAVFVHYGDAVQLALRYLGPDRLQFRNLRLVGNDDIKIANGNGSGNSKNAKVAFTDTLFTFERLQEIGHKTHDLLDALAAKDRLDAFQTAKWQKEIAQVNAELKKAEEEIRLPSKLSKVGPEAKLLAIHAKATSLTVTLSQ